MLITFIFIFSIITGGDRRSGVTAPFPSQPSTHVCTCTHSKCLVAKIFEQSLILIVYSHGHLFMKIEVAEHFLTQASTITVLKLWLTLASLIIM